jgi:pimeloyl-ACP methyl ester carboxylesterase
MTAPVETGQSRATLAGADGLQLAFDVAGDPADPPVLLLPGSGQTRHAWDTTLQALGQRGWRAYSVDLRGHGDSDWSPEGDYGIEAFIRDVGALAAPLDRPVIVGASLGGTASMMAISEWAGPAPLARALVLVDVAVRFERTGSTRIFDFMTDHLESGFESLEEVAESVSRFNPHRPRPKDLSGLLKNLRKRPDGRWTWHWDPAFMSGRVGQMPEDPTPEELEEQAERFAHFTGRIEGAARSLEIPTLLVRGGASEVLSEAGAHEFLELAPRAQIADVAGAGHMVAGDRNDAFNAAVLDFLDAVRVQNENGS